MQRAITVANGIQHVIFLQPTPHANRRQEPRENLNCLLFMQQMWADVLVKYKQVKTN